ncbi:hypothetical protein FB451DRAFT_325048 [Mycena latifolia]|nr:hypothetical protein FB451DRAFT_325048 [Mycena latifolia]
MYLGDSDSEDEVDFGQDYPLEVTLDFSTSEAESDDEDGMATHMRGVGLLESSIAALHSRLVMYFEKPARPFPYARNAPRLTDITLDDYPHENIALQWSSIRHLSEICLPPIDASPLTNLTATYLKLLRDNPRLESLQVSYDSPPSPFPSSSLFTPMHHSLRRLVTTEESLIRALTLPHLEELNLEAKNLNAILAIRDLLTRSKCALQKLRLNYFGLPSMKTSLPYCPAAPV